MVYTNETKNQTSLSTTLRQLVNDFLVKYNFISPVAESSTSTTKARHSQATTLSKSITTNKRAVSDSAVISQQNVRTAATVSIHYLEDVF